MAKVLNEKEQKVFEYYFQIKQHNLKKALQKFLEKHYSEVIVNERYLIAVGATPVALVAHLDTVFSTPPKTIYYDRSKNVMWSPEGLGADDRAGVFAIVEIIRRGYRPSIIFTTDEEMGGVGARAMVMDHPKPFTHLKYVIELDRQGKNDCVFYQCGNEDFKEYVQTFGFKLDFGTYTDICEFCPTWKVAGVNVSVGYKNEHRFIETLNIGWLFDTIDRVCNMLEDTENCEDFLFLGYLTLLAQTGYDPAYGISPETWLGWISAENQYICNHCKHPLHEYESFKVYDEKSNEDVYFCADCLNILGHTNWCVSCFEPFIPLEENKNDYLVCKKCLEEAKNGSSKH